MDDFFENLRGKKVDIECADCTYSGIVMDLLASDLLLEVGGQMITVSYDLISSIRTSA